MAGLDEGTYTLDKAKVMNLVSVAEQAQRQLKGCLLYTSPSPRD